MRDIIEETQSVIRVGSANLGSILDTGALQNRFQGATEDSGTRADAGFWREEWEQRVFGEGQHPIYGFLADTPSAAQDKGGTPQGVARYGDVVLVLKDEVRERTTFLLGDSGAMNATPYEPGITDAEVMANAEPQPLTDPSSDAWDWAGEHTFRTFEDDTIVETPLDLPSADEKLAGGGYYETQILGGVAVSDIASVVFTVDVEQMPWQQSTIDPLQERLTAAGIPWENDYQAQLLPYTPQPWENAETAPLGTYNLDYKSYGDPGNTQTQDERGRFTPAEGDAPTGNEMFPDTHGSSHRLDADKLKSANVEARAADLVRAAENNPVLRDQLANWSKDLAAPLGVRPDATWQETYAYYTHANNWNPINGPQGADFPKDPVEQGAHVYAAQLQDTWASSASDTTPPSLALQMVVAEKFDIEPKASGLFTDLAPQTVERMSRGFHDTQVYEDGKPRLVTSEEARTIAALEYLGHSGEVVREYANVTYAATQSYLAENGIKSLALARGVNGVDAPSPPQHAFRAEVTINPVSSWSTNLRTAASFGRNGTVYMTDVPAKDVFAIPMTGPGCLHEYEALVVGLPLVALQADERTTVTGAIQSYLNNNYVDAFVPIGMRDIEEYTDRRGIDNPLAGWDSHEPISAADLQMERGGNLTQAQLDDLQETGALVDKLTPLFEKSFGDPGNTQERVEGGRFGNAEGEAIRPESTLGAIEGGQYFHGLSEGAKQLVMQTAEEYGVKYEDIKAEIRERLGIPPPDAPSLQDGAKWYPDANRLSVSMANMSVGKVTPEQAAAVLSVLSPQNSWQSDAETGARMVQWFADGNTAGLTPKEATAAFRAEWEKQGWGGQKTTGDLANAKNLSLPPQTTRGFAMLMGQKTIEEILPSNKVRAFYNNIIAPTATTNVTVDVHMGKAVGFASGVSKADFTKLMKEGSKQGERIRKDGTVSKVDTKVASVGYTLIAAAVREVAAEIHVGPDVLQAAYWVAVQHIEPEGWKPPLAQISARMDYAESLLGHTFGKALHSLPVLGRLLDVDEAAGEWDPIDFWTEEERARAYAREEAALPRVKAQAYARWHAEAKSFGDPGSTQERDEHGRFGPAGGDRSDIPSERYQDEQGAWRVGGSAPGSTDAGVNGTGRAAALLLKLDVENGGQQSDISQTGASLLKSDNVLRIGAALVERAQKDPALAEQLDRTGVRTVTGLREKMSIEDALSAATGVNPPNGTTYGNVTWQTLYEKDYLHLTPGVSLTEVGAREVAARMQDTWMHTASDSNALSWGMQLAVAELTGTSRATADAYFGASNDPDAPGRYSTGDYGSIVGLSNLESAASAWLPLKDQAERIAASPAVKAYVEQVYTDTQAYLKEQSVTELTLYRGVQFPREAGPGVDLSDAWPDGAAPDPFEGFTGERDEVVSLNPVSSFSADAETARYEFGSANDTSNGYTFSTTVPAERIFSIPLTGPGCLSEEEFLVLGGDTNVHNTGDIENSGYGWPGAVTAGTEASLSAQKSYGDPGNTQERGEHGRFGPAEGQHERTDLPEDARPAVHNPKPEFNPGGSREGYGWNPGGILQIPQGEGEFIFYGNQEYTIFPDTDVKPGEDHVFGLVSPSGREIIPSEGFVRAFDTHYLGPLKVWAEDHDMTQRQLLDAMTKNAQEWYDKHLPCITLPHEKLASLMNDGKFRNQFTAKESNGAYKPGLRKNAESELFGLPVTGTKADERPVYGYIGDKVGDGKSGFVSQYGDVNFILKDEIRARTTVTQEDSLTYAFVPEPMNSVSWRQDLVGSSSTAYSGSGREGQTITTYSGRDYADFAWHGAEEADPGEIVDPKDLPEQETMHWDQTNPLDVSAEYVEAQYHGGVSLDDVERIAVYHESTIAPYRADLEARGIAVEVRSLSGLRGKVEGGTNSKGGPMDRYGVLRNQTVDPDGVRSYDIHLEAQKEWVKGPTGEYKWTTTASPEVRHVREDEDFVLAHEAVSDLREAKILKEWS